MHASTERRNLVTSANAVELATRAILKLMGNDCAATENGQKLTRQLVADAVTARLNGHMDNQLRGDGRDFN